MYLTALISRFETYRRALGSLILHHSYAHSCFSIKFSARSAHSQALERKSTLAFGWLRATMSSAVSKLPPPAPIAASQKKLKQRAHSQQVEREPSCPFITPSISKKTQVQIILLILMPTWPHQKENSCQQPHSCFIVLWWGGVRAGFWEKKSKQAFHLLVKKNAKSTTGFFLPNL